MLPVVQHEMWQKSPFSHIFTALQGGFVDQKGQHVLTKILSLKGATSQVSKTVSTMF